MNDTNAIIGIAAATIGILFSITTYMIKQTLSKIDKTCIDLRQLAKEVHTLQSIVAEARKDINGIGKKVASIATVVEESSKSLAVQDKEIENIIKNMARNDEHRKKTDKWIDDFRERTHELRNKIVPKDIIEIMIRDSNG